MTAVEDVICTLRIFPFGFKRAKPGSTSPFEKTLRKHFSSFHVLSLQISIETNINVTIFSYEEAEKMMKIAYYGVRVKE